MQRRFFGKRRGLAAEPGPVFLQTLDDVLGQARADVSRVLQFPAHPVTHEQCAQRFARTLALGVAADDELRGLAGFDLQPRG
jgi:hypothetical protein